MIINNKVSFRLKYKSTGKGFRVNEQCSLIPRSRNSIVRQGKRTLKACLRNILGTEIRDNSIDKIVPHDHSTDRFPITGIFTKQ